MLDDWLFSRPCSSKLLIPAQIAEYASHFQLSCTHILSDKMFTRSPSEKVGDLLNRLKQRRVSYRASYAVIDSVDLESFSHWYKFDNKSVHEPICRNDFISSMSICCFARGARTCSQEHLLVDDRDIQNAPEEAILLMRGNISHVVTNFSVNDEIIRDKFPSISKSPVLLSYSIEDALNQELVGKLPKISNTAIPLIGISVLHYHYLLMFPVILASIFLVYFI